MLTHWDISRLVPIIPIIFILHLNDAESGADGIPSNNLQQQGTGVNVGSVSSDFSQGTIEITGLDLDLAIQEKHSLMVEVFSRLQIQLQVSFFILELVLLNQLLMALLLLEINLNINYKD